jgi:hypothetical protein
MLTLTLTNIGSDATSIGGISLSPGESQDIPFTVLATLEIRLAIALRMRLGALKVTQNGSDVTLNDIETGFGGLVHVQPSPITQDDPGSTGNPYHVIVKQSALPEGSATEAGLGTDGDTGPLVGSGIRGWLRSIYNRLMAVLSVNVTDEPTRQVGIVSVTGSVEVNDDSGSLTIDTPQLPTSLVNDLLATQSVLVAKTHQGSERFVVSDSHGHMGVNVFGPSSAFGEVVQAALTPVVQLDFFHGIHPDLAKTKVESSGGVAISNGLAVVSTGLSAGATAEVRSTRHMKRRTGQGLEVRFTAKFSPEAGDSVQYAGPFGAECGFMVGVNGALGFGVGHLSGGVLEIRTLTITLGAGGAEVATVTLDGNTKLVNLTAGKATHVAWLISQEDYTTVGDGWYASQLEDTVLFISSKAKPYAGTFTLASTGVAAGVFGLTTAGAIPTLDWTAQEDFNEDTLDGFGSSGLTIDPTKLNHYKVVIANVGAGDVIFTLSSAEVGHDVTFHRIIGTNTRTIPLVDNPGSGIRWLVDNKTNTTTVSLATAGGAGFIQGTIKRVSSHRGTFSTKSGVASSFVPLLSLQCASYSGFGSVPIRMSFAEISPSLMSLATDGTKPVEVVVLLNATLGAGASFASLDPTSIANIDTGATTVLGGTQIYSVVLGKIDTTQIRLLDLDFVLSPGDTLTVAAKTASGTSDVSVGFSWFEDL